MKFSSRIFVFIIGFISVLPTQALPIVEKGLLSSILPNVQILFDGEQDLPVFVRVANISGDGECQEPSSACEQDALYVVISDNEKLPVISVTYSLGKAHEWALKSVGRCAVSKDDLCAKVALDQTLSDAAGKAWKIAHHVYEFRMNSVKEIEAVK